MTRKEKIIEILQMVDKYHYCLDSDIERHADAILALPLDAPSDKEIKDEIFANNPVSDGDLEWIYGFRQGQFSGAKMMRDEIIKRNK